MMDAVSFFKGLKIACRIIYFFGQYWIDMTMYLLLWRTVDNNSQYLIGNIACIINKFFTISLKNSYEKCFHLHINFHKIHLKSISIVCQTRVYIKLICKSIIMLPKHSFVTRNESESIYKTL